MGLRGPSKSKPPMGEQCHPWGRHPSNTWWHTAPPWWTAKPRHFMTSQNRQLHHVTGRWGLGVELATPDICLKGKTITIVIRTRICWNQPSGMKFRAFTGDEHLVTTSCDRWFKTHGVPGSYPEGWYFHVFAIGFDRSPFVCFPESATASCNNSYKELDQKMRLMKNKLTPKFNASVPHMNKFVISLVPFSIFLELLDVAKVLFSSREMTPNPSSVTFKSPNSKHIFGWNSFNLAMVIVGPV